MERQEIVNWLNYRIEITAQMGRHNHFTMTDIIFFTDFLREKTGERVHINRFANSIRNHSDSCLDWVERLINHCVFTHNIETVLEESPNLADNILLRIPVDSRKILKYK